MVMCWGNEQYTVCVESGQFEIKTKQIFSKSKPDNIPNGRPVLKGATGIIHLSLLSVKRVNQTERIRNMHLCMHAEEIDGHVVEWSRKYFERHTRVLGVW